MLTAALKFLKLVLNNLERSLLIAALVAAGSFSYLYNMEVENREAGELMREGLPKGVLAKYVIRNRELTKMVKDAEGKTRVVKIYIPDEGKVTVITKERDQAIEEYKEVLERLKTMTDEEEIRKAKKTLDGLIGDVNKPPEVIVKNKGFTSRFGYGMTIGLDSSTEVDLGNDRKLDLPIMPMLDWKFVYWKRWSATVGVTPRDIGPGITRHIDDITPRKLNMKNLELGIRPAIEFTGGRRLDVILRNNF